MGLAQLKMDIHDEFHLHAALDGKDGDIVCRNEEFSFVSQDEIYFKVPYRKLSEVELRDTGDDSLELWTGVDTQTFNFHVHGNQDNAEYIFYYIKSKFLTDKKRDEFVRDYCSLSHVEARKMIDDEVIVRFLDGPGKLFENELIEGALTGRFSEDFSHHQYGVLTITNRRVFFFDRHGLVRTLSRDEVEEVRVLQSFDNFSDAYGRKTYNIEFNNSDFIICVQSDRLIKIEMFYKTLEPEKKLDLSY